VQQSNRQFTFNKAIRQQVPLLIGLVGPSGVGKTFSALRLARGIQRVTGGRIKGIDTEHKRMSHYSDDFDFDCIDFRGPFGSLDYLAAIQEAAKTPGPIIVDSLSHEHDGPGGYLEFHEQEVRRLIEQGGFRSEYAASVPAWAKPAEHRRKLIQGIIHLGVTCIFCFRAKEKLDLNGKDENGKKTVKKLGWMPIAGDAFVYEMTMKCLLLPGADGVPTWHPEEAGEKMMCKLPGQFRPMFEKKQPLSEDLGEQLARWASGSMPASELLAGYAACNDRETFDRLEAGRKQVWASVKADVKSKLKAASDAAATRLNELTATAPQTSLIPGVDEDAATGAMKH
jgi:hypothetical protein